MHRIHTRREWIWLRRQRAIAVEERLEAHPFIPVSVDPGVMDTEMQAVIRKALTADFPDVECFRKRKTEGGLVAPEAVAKALIAIATRENLEAGVCYDLPTASV